MTKILLQWLQLRLAWDSGKQVFAHANQESGCSRSDIHAPDQLLTRRFRRQTQFGYSFRRRRSQICLRRRFEPRWIGKKISREKQVKAPLLLLREFAIEL